VSTIASPSNLTGNRGGYLFVRISSSAEPAGQAPRTIEGGDLERQRRVVDRHRRRARRDRGFLEILMSGIVKFMGCYLGVGRARNERAYWVFMAGNLFRPSTSCLHVSSGETPTPYTVSCRIRALQRRSFCNDDVTGVMAPACAETTTLSCSIQRGYATAPKHHVRIPFCACSGSRPSKTTDCDRRSPRR